MSDMSAEVAEGSPSSSVVAFTVEAPTSTFPATLYNSFSSGWDIDVIEANKTASGCLTLPSLDMSDWESKLSYFRFCLKTLHWCFSDRVMGSTDKVLFFAGAVEEMDKYIEIYTSVRSTPENMRYKLPIGSVPFLYATHSNLHELPKDDEVRQACQLLFLLLLRPHIPVKYASVEEFMASYETVFNDPPKHERWLQLANWMDLVFYTVSPMRNKDFVINLILRIVDGRQTSGYIRGGGRNRSSQDVVQIYEQEGNVIKTTASARKRIREEDKSQETMLSTYDRGFQEGYDAGYKDGLAAAAKAKEKEKDVPDDLAARVLCSLVGPSEV